MDVCIVFLLTADAVHYCFLSFFISHAVWQLCGKCFLKPSLSFAPLFPVESTAANVRSPGPKRPILVFYQWDFFNVCLSIHVCESLRYLTSVLMLWSAVNVGLFLQRAASSVSSVAPDPLWVSYGISHMTSLKVRSPFSFYSFVCCSFHFPLNVKRESCNLKS